MIPYYYRSKSWRRRVNFSDFDDNVVSIVSYIRVVLCSLHLGCTYRRRETIIRVSAAPVLETLKNKSGV